MQQNDRDRDLVFQKICKERGLKITPQRTAVYEAIADLKTHPSADEVYQRVRSRFPHVSFDTVNRTLLTFTEIGLIDIIESSSGVRRFDPQITPHHHLQCIECGKIIDFTNPGYDSLPVPRELQETFQVFKTRVFLTGICSECQEKKRN